MRLKGGPPFHDNVCYTAEALRDNRHRLPLAVLAHQLLVPHLSPIVAPQEPPCRLAEGPSQIGVTDLVVAATRPLAGRLVHALHQPRVGNEVPRLGKATNVTDLVHQRESKRWAYAGNGAQERRRPRVVAARLDGYLPLDVSDLLV